MKLTLRLVCPPLLTCHAYILEELRVVGVGVGGGNMEDDGGALDGCTKTKAVESRSRIEIGSAQCRFSRSKNASKSR